MSEPFLESLQCRSRAACGSCRASSEWRRLLGAPDECPHGVTINSLPRVDFLTYAGLAGVSSAARGPGTELKKLLAGWPFHITSTSTCPCNARAAEMDANGCDWCEKNIDTIVGWLREQAQARGLPFLDAVGRILVRRAIGNARRAEKQS